MNTERLWSHQVAHSFNQAAHRYDQHARLQQQVAAQVLQQLYQLVLPAKQHIQHLVDLGCGTGDIALGLQQRWPNAQLTLVDLAPAMLAVSRARLQAARAKDITEGVTQSSIEMRFVEGNVADHQLIQSIAPADCVVSSLCLQWLPELIDLSQTLAHWLKRTRYFIFTLPLADSLSLWRAAHSAAQQTPRWRMMPTAAALYELCEQVLANLAAQGLAGRIQNFSVHTHTVPYANGLAFARHLKAIGAQASDVRVEADTSDSHKAHSLRSLRPVLRWLDKQQKQANEFIADYQIAYVVLESFNAREKI